MTEGRRVLVLVGAPAFQHLDDPVMKHFGVRDRSTMPDAVRLLGEPRPEHHLVPHEVPSPDEVAPVAVGDHRGRVGNQPLARLVLVVGNDPVEDQSRHPPTLADGYFDADMGTGVRTVQVELPHAQLVESLDDYLGQVGDLRIAGYW